MAELKEAEDSKFRRALEPFFQTVGAVWKGVLAVGLGAY